MVIQRNPFFSSQGYFSCSSTPSVNQSSNQASNKSTDKSVLFSVIFSYFRQKRKHHKYTITTANTRNDSSAQTISTRLLWECSSFQTNFEDAKIIIVCAQTAGNSTGQMYRTVGLDCYCYWALNRGFKLRCAVIADSVYGRIMEGFMPLH